MNSLLQDISVEALFAGNVTEADAKDAECLLLETLNPTNTPCECQKPQVIKVPSDVENHLVAAPTRDPNESNTAIEVYFQLGEMSQLMGVACFLGPVRGVFVSPMYP